MAASSKTSNLSKKLDRVVQTPASFSFFVAIHDFVENLEAHESFSKLKLPKKYEQLKEIHRGIKDTQARQEGDLGHNRYMVIQSLLRIRENDVSDSNPLWKKREMLRAASVEVYKLLTAFLEEN